MHKASKYLLPAYLFIVFLLISGCGSIMPSPSVKMTGMTKASSKSSQKYGYILLSLGKSLKSYIRAASLEWSTIDINYLDDPNGKSHIIVYNNGKTNDFHTKGTSETLFLIKVPTGRYSIDKVGFRLRIPGGTYTNFSKKPLHIVFRVKEGEITYLGSFIMKHQLKLRDRWGMQMMTPSQYAYFLHDYRLTRDKNMMYKKYPYMKQHKYRLVSLKRPLDRPYIIKSGRETETKKPAIATYKTCSKLYGEKTFKGMLLLDELYGEKERAYKKCQLALDKNSMVN